MIAMCNYQLNLRDWGRVENESEIWGGWIRMMETAVKRGQRWKAIEGNKSKKVA